MLAGSFVVSHITTTSATWLALLLLIMIHLWTNYLAIHAVSMRTLNRQRANIVYSNYLESLWRSENYSPDKSSKELELEDLQKHSVLTPEEVSSQERIFELDGVIRWRGATAIGTCTLGCSLKSILPKLPLSIRDSQINGYTYSHSPTPNKSTHAKINISFSIEALFELFANENYILYYYYSSSFLSPPQPRFVIILKEEADTKTQLKSWFHVVLCARKLQQESKPAELPILEKLRDTLIEVDRYWENLVEALDQAGWDTENGALETRSGTRVDFGRKKK
jgi:hypothetical protein